ncbi:glycine/sarcosine/betaine reductase component B subunit [Clostridioides mangenotii]|uniref:glycine/sarcosine/betaine reductase component B subunit n=1 Tax=Metaclostridioides mangenotii TaxID=1540 RepID=UPI001C1165C2|nr:glycine/sarcosine/betaine reductase component B subunit [Clostridioides mangenotii]MBU5307086.1 glycine/sarcosine/betaine reductase component B subunit [Clostridioides mangenotii]MCR1953906.1 glycine/sarcosine/betaine reductase component B subunit [Clostridioides mangenotii]
MGIGPSTKETSLHHFRDPLLDVVGDDKDVDFVGVVVLGTPQDNKYKNFVGQRTAAWLEAMRVDGVILSSDGWGNSHVDYANTFEEIGKRDIPTVGVTFNGVQAKFVVTNQYMDTIVDINKSKDGIETEVVGENNTNEIDAKKALAFLKLKMRNHEK